MRTIWGFTLVGVLFATVSCDAGGPFAKDSASAPVIAGRVAGPVASQPEAAPTAIDASPRLMANQAADASLRQFPGRFGSDSIIPSMVIRTAQASIEVDSLEAAVVLVRQLAQRVGGYVANSSMLAGKEQLRSATLEVKLPANRFDQAIEGLKPIGKVEFVNTTAEDVGEEYVDIQARVANGRRLEQRLVELLATRTGRLADVLSVEQQLARVREEIERMEGRVRYLRTRSAVSTLSITVHEEAPVVAGPGSFGVLGEALEQAWRNFIAFLAACIESLGVLVPLAVLGVGTVILLRRHLPRRPPPTT